MDVTHLLAVTLFTALLFISCSSALKEGQTCMLDRNCDAGLHCEACLADGNVRPRCTRVQPSNPTSKVKGLPFNRYSWLTTHNSFAQVGAKSATGTPILTFENQQDSITSQLKNGVRGLMLDMYDFMNDIWLCHSFGGNCYNYTAFQPAINVLKEIKVFLEGNPSEIVTIIIEDYVSSPKGLTKVFDAAGLRRFWFPVSRMPKNGGDWSTVDDMVQKNQRLVVFTSKAAKEASEGIAYEWRYVVENQYGNGGMKAGSCPNRAESPPMSTKTRSLVLMNHFPDNPELTQACKQNSGPLLSMLNTCYEAAGRRWLNFIAVDFYKRSNGGGARDVVRAHVGAAAERLIHLFCVVPRQSIIHDDLLFRYTDQELIQHLKVSEMSVKNAKEKGLFDPDEDWRKKVESVLPAAGITVKHIRTGEDVAVSRRVMAIFLLMTMADFSDQIFGFQDVLFDNSNGRLEYSGNNSAATLWPGDGKPGLWLNSISRMGALYSLIAREEEIIIEQRRVAGAGKVAGDRDEDIELVIPPVFEKCTRVLDAEEQKAATELYWEGVCEKSKNDLDGAEEVFLRSIEKNPFVGEPHVVLAQVYLAKSRFEEAEVEAERGLRLLLEWGSPWDKRMSWEGWVAWCRVLLMKARDKSWPNASWGILNLGLVK